MENVCIYDGERDGKRRMMEGGREGDTDGGRERFELRARKLFPNI